MENKNEMKLQNYARCEHFAKVQPKSKALMKMCQRQFCRK